MIKTDFIMMDIGISINNLREIKLFFFYTKVQYKTY